MIISLLTKGPGVQQATYSVKDEELALMLKKYMHLKAKEGKVSASTIFNEEFLAPYKGRIEQELKRMQKQ